MVVIKTCSLWDEHPCGSLVGGQVENDHNYLQLQAVTSLQVFFYFFLIWLQVPVLSLSVNHGILQRYNMNRL